MASEADHLQGMAAQLLAMLTGRADGKRRGRQAWEQLQEKRRGRQAWEQLQEKLAQVATYVADPRIPMDALLELLKDARGLSFPTEAEPLLRQIMKFLEEETRKALHAGMAIPRLRELLLVLASQLDMLPLRDSEPVHMVDANGNFCEEAVADIIKCSPELSARHAAYAVVSIVGAQSSGKSYLLNRLFGTTFPVMDVKMGRSQTTKGIMISRCIGPSLLVLDIEGFDGRERGQDTVFEKQAALFALTMSDIMLVNMSIHDIGRQEAGGILLFRTIFKERQKLPEGLTKILVVLRFCDEETPMEVITRDVMCTLEEMWKRVNVESRKFEDYIEVHVVGLPDKWSPDFSEELTALRRLLSNTTRDNNRSAKVPASNFSISSQIFWDKIKMNKKLDIPSHQVALALLFCRQTVDDALKSIDSHKDYMLLKAEESPRRFKEISDTLLESMITMYDQEMEMFDGEQKDNERQHMVENIKKVFIEDSRELIRKVRRNASEQFKGEYAKHLKIIEETNADLNYDDLMVDSCVEKFLSSCQDLKVFASDYIQMKSVELQKELHSYIVYHTLTIKEKRTKQNLEDLLKRLEEAKKERQVTETEKQLKEALEYTGKMLAKQQEHTEKMLAKLAVQTERMDKMIATLHERTVSNLRIPGCKIM